MTMNPQREEEEIQWLERLWALPSGAHEMGTEKKRLNELVSEALKEMELAAKRVGKDSLGTWCFACGRSVPTADCTCPYPESFNCAGHKYCLECREARGKIARHLEAMFAAKISHRVSGRRRRKCNMIARAADTEGLRRGQALRTALFKYADPDVDEPEAFVSNTLRAFKRSGFFDFRALAAAVEREENEYLVLCVVKSGIFGRPRRREGDMSAAGLKFYT
jgi:hypothetical protein